MPAKVSATKVSVNNTPQARDDTGAVGEGATAWFDVLANDLGGSALSLYSLSADTRQTTPAANILGQGQHASIVTSLGALATIALADGRAGITYDTNTPQASRIDELNEGQEITDSFSYVIQLGDGAFAVATVSVTITGTNDAPRVAGFDAGRVSEDLVLTGTLLGDDIDAEDDSASLHHEIVGQPAAGLGTVALAGRTFTYTPGADLQQLDAGETATVSFTYRAIDSRGAASTTETVTITVIGANDGTPVIDGYIANALVFRDVNGNSVRDAGEAFTFTDANGVFTDLAGEGRVVVAPRYADDGVTVLTRDLSTGDAFTATLSAPAGATVVTPLTTLVDALVNALYGDNAAPTAQEIAAVNQQVVAALGLPLGTDLTDFDPIEVIASPGSSAAEVAGALDVQKAAVQIANILAVVGSALDGANADGAAQLATSALAGQFLGANGQVQAVDLTDPAVLTSVVTSAAQAGGVADQVGPQAAAIGTALGNINGVIETTEVDGDGLAALAAIVTAQIVAQDQLAGAAQDAVSGDTDLAAGDFSGGALTDRLDQAANEVEVIVPTDTAGQTLGVPGRPQVDDGNRVSADEAADGVVVTVAYGDSSGTTPGDTLRLSLGSMVVATYELTAGDVPAAGQTLTHSFVVAKAALGADGTKVLTARFVEQDGSAEGPSSLPLVVTLDTVADLPAQVRAVEGPIVSAVEAADGTAITGVNELGSSVSVVVSNGAVTLERAAVVDGTSFTLNLSATDLATLGEGYIRYAAVATDAAGNVSASSATGQFFYTRLPIVDSATRIDTGETAALLDDDAVVRVTALADGEFAVHWATGADEGEISGFAVQRYAADGSKSGPVVVLHGVAARVLDDAEGTFDLTTLANGDHILTYGLERESASNFVTVTGNGGAQIFSVVGQPEGFFVSGAPGATYLLFGRNTSGASASVQLFPVNGRIEITQAILDQFSVDNRFSLVVMGVAPAQQLSVTINTIIDQSIDTDAALLTTTQISAANNAGIATVGAAGRAEAFAVQQVSPASPTSSPTYQVLVTPAFGQNSVDISGIARAAYQPNGTISITVTPVDGLVVVPQLLLDRLGDQDVAISLSASGLVAGSTFSSVVSARPAVTAPEGIFVQQFASDGTPIGGPGARIDAAAPSDIDDDEAGSVGVTALADGGFIVRWLADEGDGEDGGLAIQRFAADGAKVGGVTLLQGVADIFTEADEASFDLTALDNGGYALTVGLEHGEAVRQVGVPVPGGGIQANFVPIVGVPSEIYVSASPTVSPSFTLAGRNSANTASVEVAVTVTNGRIEVTQDILDQFLVDNRLALLIRNPTATFVNLTVVTEIDQMVDLGAPISATPRSITANAQGVAALAGNGRTDSIDIDGAVGAGVRVQIVLTPSEDVDLSGTGAIRQPNGQLWVSGLIPDANGVVRVPGLLLQRLEDQDVAVTFNVQNLTPGSTLAATVYSRPYLAAPEGVFVQVFDANGVAVTQPGTRLDIGSSPAELDDNNLGASPTANGGFLVRWVIDADNDGEGDGFAVQRFAADGTPAGPVVTLEGVPEAVLEADDPGFDITALDNGGYAMTYGIGLQGHERTALITAAPNTPNQTAFVPLTGRVEFISLGIEGAFPTSPVTYTLLGVGNDGLPRSVAVTPAFGGIEITQAILDQFGADNRLTLQVGNLQPGQAFSFFFEAFEDVTYDLAAPLHAVAASGVATPGPFAGTAVLGTPYGRAEGFHVDPPQFAAGQPHIYLLTITPVEGGHTLNLAGIAGASLDTATDQVRITVTPTAGGDIAVPEAILDQLGTDDAAISLVVLGLQVGSTLTGSVSVRDPLPVTEGLFVQTFDDQGNPVHAGLALTGTADDDNLIGDTGDDVLAPLAGDDVLTGGAGRDVFDFDSILGTKTITDFAPGVDRIDVSGIDANPLTHGDDAFVFLGAGAFGGVAGELRAETVNGQTLLSADLDGDRLADFSLILAAAPPLTQVDIIA